jgi:general stress protein 26
MAGKASHRHEEEHRHDDIKKLADLIRGIRVAMLTTLDGTDMRSRPMATLDTTFDGDLWFFTWKSAPKVDEIRTDQRVNVTFADPGGDRYVSMSGHALIVRDPAKNRDLWSPALSAWFPGGPDDRDLVLLRIPVDSAEYWDSQSGTMVRLFEYARAIFTGKPPNGASLGENKKVHVR